MIVSVTSVWPVWTTLLLAVSAEAFLVRLLFFFHDCCHGSYLPSRKAMDALGSVLGVLTFTPYGEWRHSHGIHHSTHATPDSQLQSPGVPGRHPRIEAAVPLSLRRSLASVRLILWDEAGKRLLSFREAGKVLRSDTA